ncbi:MAG TPA: OB-fold domain-containing protein [Ilumatobacteraceae bacterium]
MGALPAGWGLPELTPTNETWFTSAALAVQQCVACATLQHPPEEICHSCLGTEFGTTTLAPSGTVHSYTVVHYATNPALVDAVPYAVVLVALDDAPHLRVVGNMPETPLDEVRIGLRVVPYWEDRVAEDGAVVRLPQWRPV